MGQTFTSCCTWEQTEPVIAHWVTCADENKKSNHNKDDVLASIK